jgi:hypothetical protein
MAAVGQGHTNDRYSYSAYSCCCHALYAVRHRGSGKPITKVMQCILLSLWDFCDTFTRVWSCHTGHAHYRKT